MSQTLKLVRLVTMMDYFFETCSLGNQDKTNIKLVLNMLTKTGKTYYFFLKEILDCNACKVKFIIRNQT